MTPSEEGVDRLLVDQPSVDQRIASRDGESLRVPGEQIERRAFDGREVDSSPLHPLKRRTPDRPTSQAGTPVHVFLTADQHFDPITGPRQRHSVQGGGGATGDDSRWWKDESCGVAAHFMGYLRRAAAVDAVDDAPVFAALPELAIGDALGERLGAGEKSEVCRCDSECCSCHAVHRAGQLTGCHRGFSNLWINLPIVDNSRHPFGGFAQDREDSGMPISRETSETQAVDTPISREIGTFPSRVATISREIALPRRRPRARFA
ncbi:hypothetical protein [Saccharopolyspora sp. 5N708]|uniref:hypothetical protein n=1 Tax=Saccharopolyspora sp. 5N708 TaxID=3457424 RepID=UPI003FCF5C83